MRLFNSVLFPVDYSLPCQQAAPAVAAMAQRMQADLHLIHVMDPLPIAYREWYAQMNPSDMDLLRSQGLRRLEGFMPELFSSITVTREVWEGDPGPVIASYARQHKIELVAMPTRGHGVFRRLLLGSATAKVLHDTECPVLTSAHVEDCAMPVPSEINRILCAVDLAEDSARVLRWAMRAALAFRAELSVMHALPAFDVTAINDRVKAVNRYHEEIAQEAFAKLREETGVDRDLLLVSGGVASGLREIALQQQTDLVVIGRGVMRDLFGRLRSNAYGIIRESPCWVLSV